MRRLINLYRLPYHAREGRAYLCNDSTVGEKTTRRKIVATAEAAMSVYCPMSLWLRASHIAAYNRQRIASSKVRFAVDISFLCFFVPVSMSANPP